MTTADKKKFVEEFVERLRDEGDMFWSMGSTSKDYELITSTIKANGGYWAGNSVRYIYDKKLRFEGVQQRMFGSSV